MMRLGIDFGTTRIVVAAVDRGNYPVVAFDTPDGESREWFPSLAAVRNGEWLFGWHAWAAQEEAGTTLLRSLKRHLPDAGPETLVDVAGQRTTMLGLLTGMASALKRALESASRLRAQPGETLEIMLGVPANSNGNQRFLTSEAFRRAGFEVLGLLNEPSAASIEYGHSTRDRQKSGGRHLMAVYDLGGGTFDTSLVELDQRSHDVLASEGISELGGDDFDSLLAQMALDVAGISEQDRHDLTQAETFRLHEECRQKKEAVNPNSRRIAVDLELVREGWPAVTVPVSQFYAAAQPLIDETVHAVEDLIAGREEQIESIYVTGGASELPLVARSLREKFGRRVQRSAYAQSAAAIGLAIQADEQAGYRLRDKFSRNFGVWREGEGGRQRIFDPLFLKGTSLPGLGGPTVKTTRRYFPVHNVGHFRYLECSHTTDEGRPAGDVMLWDEILFPFDPALRDRADLVQIDVVRREQGQPDEIEETYECDSGGAVTVTISNRTAGYERRYQLGRWAAPAEPLVPASGPRKPRTPRKKSS